MKCKNCLVDPICSIGCNKLEDITVDELQSNEKIIQRILNSKLRLKLVKDKIEVSCHDGSICWYKNGKFHRDGGPAIIWYNGSKRWYKNGVYHRDDGPAVEYPNGAKEWWVNGKFIDRKLE